MNHLKYFMLRCLKRKYHSSTGYYGYKVRKNEDLTSEIATPQYSDKVYVIYEAFRNHGYKVAFLNPLKEYNYKVIPQLDPKNYELDAQSSQSICVDEAINPLKESNIKNLIQSLKTVYCDKIGVEIQHLEEVEKIWFAKNFEKLQLETTRTAEEKKSILHELIKSQVLDNFLAIKFSSIKRYGGEGAEGMIAFFTEIFKQSCLFGLNDVVIGIPHRGRLNLLTGLLQYPPVAMFQKMSGQHEFPKEIRATGDVLSHLATSVNYEFNEKPVNITLLPNPSHLEAILPVAVGYARSRLQTLKEADYTSHADVLSYPVLPIHVHGDASFAGQGVIMETLAMSTVPNYTVGGSVHLIVNNQVGFTTPAERGRSSEFSSDPMKVISAPIIHVNGDHPEEVLKAAKLAFSYRQKFQKDVLVDMLCFRRWGHNEHDDPTFTNPMLYKIIHSRKSVPDLYAEKLINEGIIEEEEVNNMTSSYHATLNEEFKRVDSYKTELCGIKNYSNQDLQKSISFYDTGISIDTLKFIGAKSVEVPNDFVVHPTLSKNFIQERFKKIQEGNQIDWATAESLAIGSLLYQGHNVRISGQDVGRGTFSQRHAMLVDQSNGEIHIPLNYMLPNQTAFYEVANSILSEEGVLSFEYGFSIENNNNLTLWEAQFGDFFNSAQVVFDTFISSGETKWLLPSKIVILLPHGYDGAGPEHSSCRLERFLQMSDSQENLIDNDNVNWHVVNPTTPAQYFHLLRHQMVSNVPKPLIIVAPKILLRHPKAISNLLDMAPGTHFIDVFGDDSIEPSCVKTVIMCTGKHFYLLQKEKETRNLKDCAIIRLEKLCPFPAESIYNEIKSFKNATNFLWSQEEHRNMGAWSFVQSRFRNILGCELQYAGRKPLGTPAVGIGRMHQEEIQFILNETFKQK